MVVVPLEDQLAFARRARDYWTGKITGEATHMGRPISMSDTWEAIVRTLEQYQKTELLLTETLNAMKGPPLLNVQWSHLDAPRFAKELKNWAVAMENSRNFWQDVANDRAVEIRRLELKL
jgi:hypothetical protein